MNISTLSEPVEQAKEKLRAYRGQLHKRADEEYKAIADAYEAMAKGKRLIDLPAVIRAGGFFEGMLPRLAVARADRHKVRFTWRNQTVKFDTSSERARYAGWSLIVSINMGRRHGVVNNQGFEEWLFAETIVPLVPADIREKIKGQLSEYHILWEVEEWKPVPPTDPYLIRHVGGDLWSIEAEWNLTELEKAVIAGTRA